MLVATGCVPSCSTSPGTQRAPVAGPGAQLPGQRAPCASILCSAPCWCNSAAAPSSRPSRTPPGRAWSGTAGGCLTALQEGFGNFCARLRTPVWPCAGLECASPATSAHPQQRGAGPLQQPQPCNSYTTAPSSSQPMFKSANIVLGFSPGCPDAEEPGAPTCPPARSWHRHGVGSCTAHSWLLLALRIQQVPLRRQCSATKTVIF